MGTPNQAPETPYDLPEGVTLKDASVNVADCLPPLHEFLKYAGLMHLGLFSVPLVVTSGKDSLHGTGSKHYTGGAVDLRVSDIAIQYENVWLLVLTVLCDRFHLTLFDERNLPGAPHFHIEIAG